VNGDNVLSPHDKLTWSQAQARPAPSRRTFGGYSDWRLPTIKELYSLIDFRAWTPAVPSLPTRQPDAVYRHKVL